MTKKIMQRFLAKESTEKLKENIKHIQITQKRAGREQQKYKDEANRKETTNDIPKSTIFINVLIINGLHQALANYGLLYK